MERILFRFNHHKILDTSHFLPELHNFMKLNPKEISNPFIDHIELAQITKNSSNKHTALQVTKLNEDANMFNLTFTTIKTQPKKKHTHTHTQREKFWLSPGQWKRFGPHE
jgi:hypothetical protein